MAVCRGATGYFKDRVMFTAVAMQVFAKGGIHMSNGKCPIGPKLEPFASSRGDTVDSIPDQYSNDGMLIGLAKNHGIDPPQIMEVATPVS